MEKDYLILKRASASRPSGEWNDNDYDVLADGVLVGRIFNAAVLPGLPWMWTLIFGHHEDRTPTHGYAETREAAMAAFAKSWRRERTSSGVRIRAVLESERTVGPPRDFPCAALFFGVS